jgi:hypothetical protein
VCEDRQLVAATGAAALDDVLAIGVLHALSEAVDAQTTAVLGLKRSLHDFYLATKRRGLARAE